MRQPAAGPLLLASCLIAASSGVFAQSSPPSRAMAGVGVAGSVKTSPAPASALALPAGAAIDLGLPEPVPLASTCNFYLLCDCGGLLVRNACFVDYFCAGGVLYCAGRPLSCGRTCTQVGPP